MQTAATELTKNVKLKKLTAANQLCGPPKENLSLLPADSLNSTGCVYPYWGLGASSRNGSHGGSARTGPGRLGFADSALEKSDFDITPIFNDYQFNVDSLLEVRLTPDFRRFGLPCRTEFLHKHNVVRVPHGDRNAAHLRKCQLEGKFISDLRLPHDDFQILGRLIATGKHAALDPGAGADRKRFFGPLRAEIGSHAAGAVAGNLGFRSIGVK